MERRRLVNTAAGREGTGRRPGRPRSEAAHAAILGAAIELVREVGYDAVTMDGIAARAGVGKATLYRRWASKDTLVAEAIDGITRAIPVPDTGSTEADLHALMRSAIRMFADPASSQLLSGLVAAMARNPRIGTAVRSGFVATFRAALVGVLERGVARGDLRADLDVPLVLDLLRGPSVHRFRIDGEPVDERLMHGVVAAVLRAFAPDPHASPAPPTSHRASANDGGREP